MTEGSLYLPYAGIGSRRTPSDTLRLMVRSGRLLARLGWTLRSGWAIGADDAFFEGASLVGTRYEIYLPKPGYRGCSVPYLESPKAEAYEIAARYHPAWPYLKPFVQALLARDVHQVLGRDLDSPSRMIVCYTPDGSLDGQGRDSGGTGMALRIAAGELPSLYPERVFNLKLPGHRKRLENSLLERLGERTP